MARRPPTPVQQARTILGAQYAPVDYAAKNAAARSASEQAALEASRSALVGLLQGGVAPAGQAYDAAVSQQQALAQGAASLLAKANPNAQAQADLSAVNAPPEQRAQLAHSLQAQFPGQGAVLNVQEGAIPGASLIAQKAAEQGYLAGLPTVAALSGEQSLRGLLARAADQQQQLQAERLRIGGQLPALVNTLTEQAQAHRQQALDNAYRTRQAQAEALYRQQQMQAEATYRQQQMRFEARQNALNRAAQAATTPAEAARIKLEQERLNAEIQSQQPTALDVYKAQTDRINAKRERQAAQSGTAGASLQYKSNSDGSIDIFNPTTGKIQRVQNPNGDTASTTGLTPYQVQRYRGTANTIAAQARTGFTDPTEKDAKGNPLFHPALTYDQAVREMEQEGVPLKIAVVALNAVYPAQYRVTRRGLKQTGIKRQNIKKR